MKKANFTNSKYWNKTLRLMATSLIPIFLLFLTAQVTAQNCTLACQENNISVDEDCIATLTPNMFINGAETSCANTTLFDILVLDENDGVIFDSRVEGGEALGLLLGSGTGWTSVITWLNKNVKVKIQEHVDVGLTPPPGHNSCWAYSYVEDNIAPIISNPPDVTMTCGIDIDPSNWNIHAGALAMYSVPALPPIDDKCNNYEVDGPFNYLESSPDCSTGPWTHIVKREWTISYIQHGKKVVKTAFHRIYVRPIDLMTEVECPLGYEGVLNPGGIPAVDMECGDDLSPASIEAAYNVTYAMPYVLLNKQVGPDDATPYGLYSEGLCNILVTYNDDDYPSCSGEKVVRTWTVWDWCSGTDKTCIQVIEAKDDSAPVVDPLDDVTMSVEPWICEATHTIQVPDAEDKCGSEILFSYIVTDYDSGEIIQEDEELDPSDPDDVQLGPGKWKITIYAKDDCGNGSTGTSYHVRVIDTHDPVPVCEDKIVATMPDDLSELKIPAYAFDAGSHDSRCGEVTIDVIRMEDFNSGYKAYEVCTGDDVSDTVWGYEVASDCVKDSDTHTLIGSSKFVDETCDESLLGFTEGDEIELTDFGPYVKFCCDDVNKDDLMVVVRVTDESGNVSYCMVAVWIDTKAEAEITCAYPDPKYCDDDLDEAAITAHFEAFPPTVVSNNLCDPAGEPVFDGYTIEFDDQCGYGLVTGTWSYDDGGDIKTCDTYFGIQPRVPFDPRSIKWPPHYTGETYIGINVECVDDERVETRKVLVDMNEHLNCTETGDLCSPEWTDPDCGLVGWSLSTDTIYFEQDVCVKVIKRWTIVDWCRWSPNDDHNDGLINDPDDENDSSCEKFVAVEDWTLADVPADGVPGFDPEDDCTDYSCFNDADNPIYFRYQDFFLSEHGDIPFGSIRNLVNPLLGENAFLTLDILQIVRNVVNQVLNHLCLLANQPIAIHIVILDSADNEVDVLSVDLGDALSVYKFFTETVPNAIPAGGSAEYYDTQIWSVDVDGYYTYDQVIKIIDETGPVVDDAELDACAYENCEATKIITKSATDSGCASTLNWNVEVKDPNGDVVHSEIFIGTSNIEFTLTTLQVGEYTITYTVFDGCNNSGIGVDILTVADCKAPTPYCTKDLASAVMTNGQVDVWAVDFDKGSADDCDGTDVQLGLRVTGSGADSTAAGVTIECANLLAGSIVDLEMWAFDKAGNGAFCDVTLSINNGSSCTQVGAAAIVAGFISTETGASVANTEVAMGSNHPEYPVTMMADEEGHFAFASNPMHNNYSVSAKRNDDYMNGVSTLDLVLIQKHILGLEDLNSPYKVIASDINNDNDVSGIDLVELRKLILDIYTELPNNTSWRFVDAGQSLDTRSPFPFTEVLNINDLSGDMMNENFVGVKVGDVNNTVTPNNAVSTEVRTNGTLAFNVEDATVNAGEIVRFEVTGENFNEVFGYQFTMNHNGLLLQTVEAGSLNVTENHIGVRNGRLTMSWNDIQGVSSNEVLFTMIFKAEQAVTLSEVISINSNVTKAEAYVGSSYEHQTVSLNFRNGNTTLEAATFELYQNEPNPFNQETIIGFKLPKSNSARISVMDVTGKTVKVINGEYARGYNEVKLTNDDISVSGLLYYRLESGEFTATKKMIVLK